MADVRVRRTPCLACPYRRDVASGVWAPEEYEKLRLYDAPTGEQPPGAFGCHATPARLCHGWAVVHSNRGGDRELLALRLLAIVTGHDVPVPEAGCALFESGNEVADHGQRDIEEPGLHARKTMSILRRYPRLVHESQDEDT